MKQEIKRLFGNSNCYLYLERDEGWFMVLSQKDKVWLHTVLSLNCQWDYYDKAKRLFHHLISYYMVYHPLDWQQNSDMKETYTRWHQICKVVA